MTEMARRERACDTNGSRTYRDIGIKVEQDKEHKPKRESDPDILSRQVPKSNQPFPTACRLERSIRRQSHVRDVDVGVEASPICESGHGDDGYRHSVVSAETSDVTMREGRVVEHVEQVGQDQSDEGKAGTVMSARDREPSPLGLT